ncbi:MAG: hypothetical protein KIT66_08450 [Chitinophagaceae bacterium]|nr:hypothetical protein [Chitinophagaceae bacterium]
MIHKIIILLCIIILPASVFAQGEMLILKKKGKVEKSFFKGSEMLFDLGMGMQKGNIYQFKNDSVFLVWYDVRPVMTSLGITISDTVSSYRYGFPYADIVAIGKEQKGWNWNAAGASLFGGGSLLTIAGLATWVFAEKDTRYYARPEFVAASAAATGIGYLLLRAKGHKMKIGRKFTLEYINPH